MEGFMAHAVRQIEQIRRRFIVHHKVMQNQTDDQVALAVLARKIHRMGSIVRQ